MDVFADIKRLNLTPWNYAYGNKIVHLLYIVSLCVKNNARLIIPCDSCLDEIFYLENNKIKCETIPPCIFEEKSAFPERRYGGVIGDIIEKIFPEKYYNIIDIIRNSKNQFVDEQIFLSKDNHPAEFSVSGHFWHYDLMPSEDDFLKFIRIRNDIVDIILEKYPDIVSDSAVSVHIRDTDFSFHLQDIFKKSILIDDSYYLRAIEFMENAISKDIAYHVFSDNIERAKNIFNGKNYIIHDDKANVDWVAMFLSKNIIQSNSTFCWTASLYNKKYSVQPACGYNYHNNNGDIPYGFLMPFSSVIDVDGRLSGYKHKT